MDSRYLNPDSMILHLAALPLCYCMSHPSSNTNPYILVRVLSSTVNKNPVYFLSIVTQFIQGSPLLDLLFPTEQYGGQLRLGRVSYTVTVTHYVTIASLPTLSLSDSFIARPTYFTYICHLKKLITSDLVGDIISSVSSLQLSSVNLRSCGRVYNCPDARERAGP